MSSSIVFERPGEPNTTTTEESEEGASVPVDSPRRLWDKKEGQPLAAMLQNKTLQTATYAVTSKSNVFTDHGYMYMYSGPLNEDSCEGKKFIHGNFLCPTTILICIN